MRASGERRRSAAAVDSERNCSVTRPATTPGTLIPWTCLIDLDIAAIERAFVQSVDGLFRLGIIGHLDKSKSL